MIQELVYTSAPRGLQPGKSGFCTVACTQGMTPNLFMMLESMSGYRHLSMECAPSPTVYSYHPISLGGRVWQVLSRISAYGLDYTQRANKLADHWVLDPSESVGRNAARLLQPSQNLLRSEWSGDPRWLPNPASLPMTSPHEEQEMKRCLHWKMVTGDEGWAGILCDNAASNRVTTIIVPPLFDILTLFEEALSLLPAMMRWQVSFSTYLTRLPPGVPCLWRGVVDGTPEADAARDGMHTSANLVDLCRPLPALSMTGLESSLYVQQARLANIPRAKVVTPSTSLTNDADESFPPPDPAFIRANTGTQASSEPLFRDGISSRFEPTSSLGDGYESVPERPNLAAVACSPEGYAASRQKIFGVVPELPAMARSKRRRENWIVGMLLVGFLLGVGGVVFYGWWFEFRSPEENVTQEPAAAVSQASAPQASTPPVPAPPPVPPPSPESAPPPEPTPQEQTPPPTQESTPQEQTPPVPPPESTPQEQMPPESTPPESAKTADGQPAPQDEASKPDETAPNAGTGSGTVNTGSGGDSDLTENTPAVSQVSTDDASTSDPPPEVFVFFKNGESSATKIESPKGTLCESVSCEEGDTGPICKLTKIVIKENKDKDGKTITEEKNGDAFSDSSSVSPLFEIKGGYLYAKKTLGSQTFDYETREKKDENITIGGMPLRVILEDKKYSPEDFVELTLEKNVTISVPKLSTRICIEGDENEVFSEPEDAFPKLNVKSQGKMLTWNCGGEWSSSDPIDITFECTHPDLKADRKLNISSIGSHSFTFEEDGSIHMGNTVLRPIGFKTINLKVGGSKEDCMMIKSLTADTTTITSSSGNETVMFLQPNGEDKKTFELDGHHGIEGEDLFGYHLTITGKKMTIVSSKAVPSE